MTLRARGRLKCLAIETLVDQLILFMDINNSRELYQNINNSPQTQCHRLLNSTTELLTQSVNPFELYETNARVAPALHLEQSLLLKTEFVSI